MPNRWKPNVTVSAVIERDQRFLLVEENTSDGLRLNTPAGHLDPAETPLQACVREVLEETAYCFTPTALVGIYMNRFIRTRTGSDITYMRFAFTGDLGQHHAHRLLDEGIVRTVWLSLEELHATAHLHRSPVVLQSIQDYLSGQRFDIRMIQADASIYSVPEPSPHTQDLLAQLAATDAVSATGQN
ncbi:MAG TPA: NUDIX hydrolase [Comamonas sp.]|uniref:NUDIX hydrolase n=1 Tax=Comamonas halotolerans TaxID=3041496 RepID=UPI0024E1243F|nr:NUDIX hydrolase [Comamonas sp. NoAH]